jgi:hypothetical protein
VGVRWEPAPQDPADQVGATWEPYGFPVPPGKHVEISPKPLFNQFPKDWYDLGGGRTKTNWELGGNQFLPAPERDVIIGQYFTKK